MSVSTDTELRLHVAVLHRRLRTSGRTLRELEDELGWVCGTLTALARNPETLRFDELFEILAAIGVEPGDFFDEVVAASSRQATETRTRPVLSGVRGRRRAKPCASGYPGARMMKAVFFDRYGSSDVLTYGDWPRPEVGDRRVLIEVHAASVNPRDWLIRSGRYFAKAALPRLPLVLGSDVAGRVVEVGPRVRRFAVGDDVFAMQPSSDGFGGYAEYIAVREQAVARKPAGMSFVEAAAVPLAGLTALQALRDDARLRPGARVVVVGASGGVGHYAVQIARSLGAEVTGVTSAANVEMVRDLGADRVIDYRKERFNDVLTGYDVVFDTIGRESLRTCSRVLASGGVYVTTVPNGANLLASIVTRPLSWLGAKRSAVVLVRSDGHDLELLRRWIEEGKLRSVIDRVHPLAEAARAHDHSRTFRTRGKNVLMVRRIPRDYRVEFAKYDKRLNRQP